MEHKPLILLTWYLSSEFQETFFLTTVTAMMHKLKCFTSNLKVIQYFAWIATMHTQNTLTKSHHNVWNGLILFLTKKRFCLRKIEKNSLIHLHLLVTWHKNVPSKENAMLDYIVAIRRRNQFCGQGETQAQPHSQGLSSYCPLRRARRDPGTRWSHAALTIENIGEGSTVIRQFVALSFVEFKVAVLRLTLPVMFSSTSPSGWNFKYSNDAKNITMSLENCIAFAK